MNPAARQVALLNAQAAAWQAAPPAERVAGRRHHGGIPAVARLLRVVAGCRTAPWFCRAWTRHMSEQAWDALDEAHPQAGLRAPAASTWSARRGDVRAVAGGSRGARSCGRAATLARALLPAKALRGMANAPTARRSMACRCCRPADQQEEAAAIAMVLREALEMPGATAALVTPDRDLAGRVATELLRYGVVADDSAGERLADTPPAVFLRLLADGGRRGTGAGRRCWRC